MRSQEQQNTAQLFRLYTIHVANRDWHKAYTSLKEILMLRPGQPKAADEIAQLTNQIAMLALKQRDFALAERFLRKGIRYSRHSPFLTLVTYNNWSCYYKKTENSSMALLSISKAVALAKHIQLNQSCPPPDKIKFLADSYLNLCVVLSSMGEHRQALESAETALKWLQKYNHVQENGVNYKTACDRNHVLTIAKYNAAVELEHLKRFAEAREAYILLRAFIREWDNDNPLLDKVEKAISSLELRSKSQGNRRSASRTSKSARKRLSLFKIEPAIHQNALTTYLDREVDTTIHTPHTLNLKRVLQQRSSNNTTALSTLSHTRSHTSQNRPQSGLLKPSMGHRRTLTKMLPLKGRLSGLE